MFAKVQSVTVLQVVEASDVHFLLVMVYGVSYNIRDHPNDLLHLASLSN